MSRSTRTNNPSKKMAGRFDRGGAGRADAASAKADGGSSAEAGQAAAAGSPAERAIPLDIYGSLVDALFEVQASLFVGSTAASLAALITAWRGDSFVLFGFGVVIAVVTYLRALDMRAYRGVRPSFVAAEQFRLWEWRYIVGAAIYVALLGSWCLATFIITNDPFVHLFSFSVVLAYMIGTSGRNFSSNPLVISQIVGAGVPLSASLFYMGGFYYWIFGIVLLPFFLGIKLISDRLRKTLLNAVISEREVSELAGRFDTALTNMPHGLCMFDKNDRVLVANKRVSALLGIADDVSIAGRHVNELFRSSPAIVGAADVDAVTFAAEFESRLTKAEGHVYAEINGERSLSFTAQPMAAGGSVVIVEDITARRNAERRIRHLARYDALTSLPNRAVFHDELVETLGKLDCSHSLSVLFIDLDQFKQVNDTLGHPIGDQLLCSVADRLRGAIGADDIVARFGGDEFAVLQADVKSRQQTIALCEKIVRAISRPYEIVGHTLIISASIGIAVAPDDSVDPDILLKNADLALYHAKADGAGRWRFFEAEMDAAVRARRDMELDLREALEKDRLELYYQPLVDLRTREIVVCEALLRWHHPERGMVPPSEFIPVAEEMGLIVEIGDWVLRQACIEATRWPADVRVAVNLSSVQFKRTDVVKTVAAALAQSGLDPNRLEVEITESVVLQDIDAAREILQVLRRSGVRVALDDFGTGYSGLSYLQTFPLNKVKIDRSFIRQLTSSDRSLILLRGIAELSAALGMTVAVEGIETEDQLDVVSAERSIHEGQGFLFSRPLPARAIRELIEVSLAKTPARLGLPLSA